MTISKAKPSGFGANDILTSVEMEIVNSQMPNFMDGVGGGSYSPSTVLTVAGAHGLTCTAPFESSGDFTCTGNVCAFNGATCAFVGATVTLESGTTLTVDATSHIVTAVGATVTCNGTTTFNGTTLLSGPTSVDTGETFSVPIGATLANAGTITNSGNITNTGIITNSGSGHYNDRLFDMTNADQTIGIAGGTVATSGADVVMLAASVLSADRVVTVTSTGALRGSRMRFSTDDNTFKLTLKNDNGVTFAFVKTPPAAGNYQWIDIIHSGAANGWRICGGLWA